MKERKSHIKSRVARILLNNPEGSLTKYRISKLTKSGYPWIHKLLKRLEDAKIIYGTEVKNFGRLFEWWRKYQIRPDYREYLVKEPLQLLANTNLIYALTTYRAENKIQNYLFPSRTDIYINKKDKLKWHKLIIKNGLVGKGNFRVIISDEQVFYNSFERDGLHFVSIPQIILDLYNEGGVCIEAADMLLKKVKKNAL